MQMILPKGLHNFWNCNEIKWIWKVGSAGVTYYVPTTRLVFAWSWSPQNILAMPKSDIFGLISLSNKMLLAFRSLWIIVNLESWWRYIIPLATPWIILNLVGHWTIDFLAESDKNIMEQGTYADLFVEFCKHYEKLETECTKEEVIQAFVGQVLVNQHLLIFMNTAT